MRIRPESDDEFSEHDGLPVIPASGRVVTDDEIRDLRRQPAVNLSMRETVDVLTDPAALRGLAEARESEQSGDVVYGVDAAHTLLEQRRR